MMFWLALIGSVFVGGWATLVHLTIKNEVRFEDSQIKEMREFNKRNKK